MASPIHIFGIRHHGLGSARSMLHALEELEPDCVLIEGPPDGDELIAHAAKEGMSPPVALLVYDADTPANAVYYPMAEFSPEWQAMLWALRHNAAVRFMDLPQAHRLAIEAERRKKFLAELEAVIKAETEAKIAKETASPTSPPGLPGEDDDEESAIVVGETEAAAGEARADETRLPALRAIEPDPLQRLAEAAGFDDGERWWEHVVEHRREHGLETFAAIREAMAELRKSQPSAGGEPGDASASGDVDEPLREAWMRKTIRAAIKEGFKKIAVVCGAWHAPALDVDATPKKHDDELLKGLPKVKTASTWVPWTYDHLTFASGYGAGVRSPGWYDHLWRTEQHILPAWMSRVARLLRDKDIDCSSAHVIEAVRLSETLASLRGRPLADLSDIADATRSIFCFDSDIAMTLIGRELLVGHVLGEVPEDTPMVPLQRDLIATQKRLRLKPEALEKQLDLDLRNDNDRERSILLHRLRLLNVDWGTPDIGGRGKGTFHEYWRLRWDPAFIVKLIQSGVLGNTIQAAAGAALAKVAAETNELPKLADRLQDAMLASLGDAATALVKRIESVAAVSADVRALMDTLPPLASLARYGNVRDTDESVVREIINGIVPRLTAGLGGAVASLNDEAADAVEKQIRSTNDALQQLDNANHLADWFGALAKILAQDTVHGIVRGRCARLLLDAGKIDAAEIARRLSLTLSHGADPAQGARWLEGFLSGSGLLLVHDAKLLGIIDAWVGQIEPELFEELLPLLRRTFTTFPAPERKQIGQIVAKDGKAAGRQSSGTGGEAVEISVDRAARALPSLVQLLGGKA